MRYPILTVALAAALLAPSVQGQVLATNLSCATSAGNASIPNGHIAWPVGNPVWEFDFFRPNNAPTDDGVGLELRNVFYRGRRVFERASVPVLNVEYDAGGCGCYRDWQDSETPYLAGRSTASTPPGTPPAQFPQPPAGACYTEATPGAVITNCERTGTNPSGVSNQGSFNGVAVEDYGSELVLTGHTSAGWYRYRVKWHLYADGRIWPEYSFASSPSSCVARPRRHHAYWRFDFDLEDTPSNDVVTETSMAGAVTTFTNEVSRTWGTTAVPTVREWTVTDATTLAGFTIEPSSADRLLAVDAFSKFDALVVRYKPIEIDDGSASCAFSTAMMNNETITNQDVVFWYRSSSARINGTCELRGPTLRPVGFVVGAEDPAETLAAAVEVQAATPNPFTPQTSVRFRVSEGQDVRVYLYDSLGRRVRTLFEGPVEAGVFETINIAGGDLPAGTYVVRVEGATAAGSTRIVLAR